MRKDIPFLPVEGVRIAIVPQQPAEAAAQWNVYLLNENDRPLRNVMITSRGYSEPEQQGDEARRTSTLRHFFQFIGPGEHQLVEPIDPSVFELTNEFWVSYFIDGQVYDKRFVFVPGSFQSEHLIPIRMLQADGVLHE